MQYKTTKRLMDIVISLLGLAIFFMPGLVLGSVIFFSVGSPIFFSQERIGLKGKRFHLIKFRTMRDLRDMKGNLRPDKERLTRFGSFLRRASLDEIPELWNVLRGDMSLVGPRPLLVDYLPYYRSDQMRRHDVRPGITGLAQIRGRNALRWDEKFQQDLYYVDHYSLWLDLKILMLTLVKTISGEGIDSAPGIPMPRFDDEMKARGRMLENQETKRDH